MRCIAQSGADTSAADLQGIGPCSKGVTRQFDPGGLFSLFLPFMLKLVSSE